VRKRLAAVVEPVVVGLGSNLPSSAHASPLQVVETAVARLETDDVRVLARSHWYESDPVPPSAQPRYINGAVAIATSLPPPLLLGHLAAVEAAFGRIRTVRNAARVLDLDLLLHGGRIARFRCGLVIPHPRLQQRRFVLQPLCDLYPDWRHPVCGRTALELLHCLDDPHRVRVVDGPAA
jgi:2-amino-4-hydroxy-6-hydroxymethyldihydropteridine diphosphokinase